MPRASKIFCPQNCNIFSVYLSITQAKQIINLLLLNHFYPVTSYRRIRKKRKATNCCIRFGHSLWSAISCQRRWLMKKIYFFLLQRKGVFHLFSRMMYQIFLWPNLFSNTSQSITLVRKLLVPRLCGFSYSPTNLTN